MISSIGTCVAVIKKLLTPAKSFAILGLPRRKIYLDDRRRDGEAFVYITVNMHV